MATLEARLKAIKKSMSKTVRVGWFKSAVYPNGASVAMIAMQNELGNPALGIPPRPFIRPAIEKNQDEWGKTVGHLVKNGSMDAMETVAILMEADVRKSIIDVETPPLKVSTIEARLRRGNSSGSPLNDTGYLLSTLTGTVE